MADGAPYADLALNIMAGNYGPASKMDTAMAAFTPNAPWARLGCEAIVDRDGRGTSSATPQIAAAAALWTQKYKIRWQAYPAGWMRVEAVRKALGESARLDSPALRERLGRGGLRANAALDQAPAAEATLAKQPEDSASFPFLRVITGLGIAAAPDARQRMLELETLQLTQQSRELEVLCPDPEGDPDRVPAPARQQFIEALIAAPSASEALRNHLRGHVRGRVVPPASRTPASGVMELQPLERAMKPPLPNPTTRRLRVFAFDPLLGTRLETLGINQTTLEVPLGRGSQPGSRGRVPGGGGRRSGDGRCYAPVDLDHPALLVAGRPRHRPRPTPSSTSRWCMPWR